MTQTVQMVQMTQMVQMMQMAKMAYMTQMIHGCIGSVLLDSSNDPINRPADWHTERLIYR